MQNKSKVNSTVTARPSTRDSRGENTISIIIPGDVIKTLWRKNVIWNLLCKAIMQWDCWQHKTQAKERKEENWAKPSQAYDSEEERCLPVLRLKKSNSGKATKDFSTAIRARVKSADDGMSDRVPDPMGTSRVALCDAAPSSMSDLLVFWPVNHRIWRSDDEDQLHTNLLAWANILPQ